MFIILITIGWGLGARQEPKEDSGTQASRLGTPGPGFFSFPGPSPTQAGAQELFSPPRCSSEALAGLGSGFRTCLCSTSSPEPFPLSVRFPGSHPATRGPGWGPRAGGPSPLLPGGYRLLGIDSAFAIHMGSENWHHPFPERRQLAPPCLPLPLLGALSTPFCLSGQTLPGICS